MQATSSHVTSAQSAMFPSLISSLFADASGSIDLPARRQAAPESAKRAHILVRRAKRAARRMAR